MEPRAVAPTTWSGCTTCVTYAWRAATSLTTVAPVRAHRMSSAAYGSRSPAVRAARTRATTALIERDTMTVFLRSTASASTPDGRARTNIGRKYATDTRLTRNGESVSTRA